MAGVALHPGMAVTSRLRLCERIGAGGMGEVWKAEHLGLGTHVAVKFITAQLLEPGRAEGALERFQREARAAARVKSPHAVQCFDHGITAAGLPFIVMELLEGEPVRARLDRGERFDLGETAEILTQVARALSAAHKADIVHRDIKPDNVFVCGSGDERLVKLFDFGVAAMRARFDKRLTENGALVGTLCYMSPEIVLGRSNGAPHDDLWSLAALAYEALTGVVPFDGPSFAAVCGAIVRGEIEPPSRRAPVDLDVDAWFDRALHRDPARRFSTARDLAQSFAALVPLGEQPILRFTPQVGPSVWMPIDPEESARVEMARSIAAAPEPKKRRWPLFPLGAIGLTLGVGAAAWLEREPSAAAAIERGLTRHPAAVVAFVPPPPRLASSEPASVQPTGTKATPRTARPRPNPQPEAAKAAPPAPTAAPIEPTEVRPDYGF
jgi:serine/threonine-protein kinase